MQGLSGKLGDQLIIKAAKGGRTIVSAKPAFNGERVFSEAQLYATIYSPQAWG